MQANQRFIPNPSPHICLFTANTGLVPVHPRLRARKLMQWRSGTVLASRYAAGMAGRHCTICIDPETQAVLPELIAEGADADVVDRRRGLTSDACRSYPGIRTLRMCWRPAPAPDCHRRRIKSRPRRGGSDNEVVAARSKRARLDATTMVFWRWSQSSAAYAG